jgi:tetratricopeptide (TPR) repeat protein
MSQKTTKAFLFLMLAFLLAFGGALPARAQQQTPAEISAMKERAGTLINQNNFIDAVPLLEKLAKAEPENADTQFFLGFTLMAQAKSTKDKEAARQLMVRARQSLVRAKQLGARQNVLDAFIESIPEDGRVGGQFSKNNEADEAMQAGEAAFTRGKIDEALALYQKALRLDPQLYSAALFSGDMYFRKDDFPNAEIWYQKAIAIDPNRETAYRYSASPLMKQKKYDAARKRYIEAYISEPFNRLAAVGLGQWAEATGARLGHPKVEIPTDVKTNSNGDVKINIDANTLLNNKVDDGSSSWLVYGITRSGWQKEKFAKTFPNEKTYRHSLAEEADAIRSVLTLAQDAGDKDKKPKTLSPSLLTLKKLNDEGLLEAYILLARADQGIAQDYAEYLKTNRDNLRRYVSDYVISGGK